MITLKVLLNALTEIANLDSKNKKRFILGALYFFYIPYRI